MADLLPDEPRDLLMADDDLVVTAFDLDFSRGLGAVTQECRIAVKMFAEEWFLDLDAGIPYLQSILARRGVNAVTLATKAAFRKQLLSVLGVVSVMQLDVVFDGSTRELTVTWQVSTSVGVTPADTINIKEPS